MRVVLDTNIHVSALIQPTGHPARIVNLWAEGHFDLLISEFILKEVNDVLHRPHIYLKYRLTEEKIDKVLSQLQNVAIMTPGHLKLEIIDDDPKDNNILSCAVEGNATHIISGDLHLKAVKSYKGILILTPSEFLALISQSSQDVSLAKKFSLL